MTVKLAILKSGENIISDFKEGYSEEKLVCYILEKPCIVMINNAYRIVGEDGEDVDNKINISLRKWPSLSKQSTVEIFPDWIITVVEPNEELKSMYEKQVLGINKDEINQDIVFTKQSDSNQSN